MLSVTTRIAVTAISTCDINPLQLWDVDFVDGGIIQVPDLYELTREKLLRFVRDLPEAMQRQLIASSEAPSEALNWLQGIFANIGAYGVNVRDAAAALLYKITQLIPPPALGEAV